MTDFLYPSPLPTSEQRFRNITRLMELHHDMQLCADTIEMVQKIKGLPTTDPKRVFYQEKELNDKIQLYSDRADRYKDEWNRLVGRMGI